jgi:hypothetical protein
MLFDCLRDEVRSVRLLGAPQAVMFDEAFDDLLSRRHLQENGERRTVNGDYCFLFAVGISPDSS